MKTGIEVHQRDIYNKNLNIDLKKDLILKLKMKGIYRFHFR